MSTHSVKLPLLALGLSLGLLTCGPASAEDPEQRLTATIDRIEKDLDARVGLLIRDSGSDWSFRHRADEPFRAGRLQHHLFGHCFDHGRFGSAQGLRDAAQQGKQQDKAAQDHRPFVARADLPLCQGNRLSLGNQRSGAAFSRQRHVFGASSKYL